MSKVYQLLERYQANMNIIVVSIFTVRICCFSVLSHCKLSLALEMLDNTSNLKDLLMLWEAVIFRHFKN